jgi:meso-butanediol dehydrogenase / (S,S)-butanediol dehydrogenase / diacetyl reductase
MRLKQKVCIITGGGSGIGRATSLLFADEGAQLVIADKRATSAQAVASECASRGAQAMAVEANVASAPDVKRMIEQAVERFGRLDVLVNNAGYGIPGTVVETDEDAWDALMAVNVRGVFLCSKYAIPVMKANGGGTIVNTASVVATVGVGNRAAYCASKGAVAALTRAIAIDHVGDGIRCNAIAPGTIDTPYFDDILKKSPDPGATRKALAARQLLGRLGTPEEIAAGILFLASDESRFAKHDSHAGRRHDRAIVRAAPQVVPGKHVPAQAGSGGTTQKSRQSSRSRITAGHLPSHQKNGGCLPRQIPRSPNRRPDSSPDRSPRYEYPCRRRERRDSVHRQAAR